MRILRSFYILQTRNPTKLCTSIPRTPMIIPLGSAPFNFIKLLECLPSFGIELINLLIEYHVSFNLIGLFLELTFDNLLVGQAFSVLDLDALVVLLDVGNFAVFIIDLNVLVISLEISFDAQLWLVAVECYFFHVHDVVV